MNVKRLLKLAALLRQNAANKTGMRFDLAEIVLPTRYNEKWKPAQDCGTVGCAMGLAAVSGAFKRAGLTVDACGEIMWKGLYTDFDDAARELFGIDDVQADALFTPSPLYRNKEIRGAAGELNVAATIEQFVRDRGLPKEVADYYDVVTWSG